MCEGLEQRLQKLALGELNPPLKLLIKDIDTLEINKSDYERYSLEVPILFLEFEDPLQKVQLPRVSPRLSEDGLLKWLEKYYLRRKIY